MASAPSASVAFCRAQSGGTAAIISSIARIDRPLSPRITAAKASMWRLWSM